MKLRVIGVLVFSMLRWTPVAAAPIDLSGEWVLTTITFGNERSERLQIRAEKGKLAGSVYRRGKNVPLTGKSEGESVQFEFKDGDGSRVVFSGTLSNGALSGKVTVSGGDQWGDAPPAAGEKDRPAAPRILDFEPVEFHRVFSSAIAPVLTIWPGDTVRTKTVDAAGVDERGRTRVLGGNPQTGPFYVEGAMPGDILVVKIKKLKLNRATAISDDGLVERALTRAGSAATWTSARSGRERPCIFPSRSPARSSTSATATRSRGTAS